MRSHILSFPSYESHYTRRTNSTKYFPPHLNLQIMYNLYAEKVENPASRKIYEREFHALKLAFKKPQVDTCHKCDILNMKLKIAPTEETSIIENEIKNHQESADLAYKTKANDKEACKVDNRKKCFSFDLQQCLPTPSLVSSVAFYKRQLWTYNLTIYDNETGQSYNHMWHEATAGRGANEIASCLFHHLGKLPSTIEEVIFYSDTCGGQN